MRFCLLVFFALAGCSAFALAERSLPPIHDGSVVAGPGHYEHDGELFLHGKVVLKHLTLTLRGPIRMAAGAALELEDVTLLVADPAGAPHGTSGLLRCEGEVRIAVRHSTMTAVGTAHPMWFVQGTLDVDHFTTTNAEIHMNGVRARLDHLKIFELEISHESQVTASDLDLVFLSTHSGEEDHLSFSDIPVNRKFSQALSLGSGARAEIKDSQLEIFLLYVHGRTEASLRHMDRVQLAIHPDCEGTLRLADGRLGSVGKPVLLPQAGESNCQFRFSLEDVNVDTWDVYARGKAKLTLEHSKVDELQANDHAALTVRDSVVYADWLNLGDDARMEIESSTVGALRLAKERPDLATSEIRVSGRGHAIFSKVRFDCGIVASDAGVVEIRDAVVGPKYGRISGGAKIVTDGK